MYLTSRLVGVFTYFSLIALTFFLIGETSKRGIKGILIFSVIALSVMAFLFKPMRGADLFRIYEILDVWKHSSITIILDHMKNNSTPVADFLYFAIAKTGINPLLPAFSCLIFYSCSFFILYDSSRRFELTNYQVSLVYLFFMSTGRFIEVVSGIRTMLAFALIALCVYQEMVCKRRSIWFYLFYLLAALIHSAALVAVIARILFLPLQKGGIKQRIWGFFLSICILVLASIYLRTEIETALNTAFSYVASSSYSYIWEYIIGAIWLIVLLMIKMKYRRIVMRECATLNSFSNIFILASILLCFTFSIFHRFVTFSVLLSIPVISEYLSKISRQAQKRVEYKNTTTVLLLSSFIMLFLASIRGDLSSFRMF